MKVRQLLQPSHLKIIFASGGVFVALCGFSGGRATSISQVCNQRLPELDLQIENAALALKPWDSNSKPGRSIASQVEDGKGARSAAEKASALNRGGYVYMAPLDRDSWARWGEQKLFEIQGYVDLTEGNQSQRKFREQLQSLSNELVSFIGYAKKGDVRRMFLALDKIKKAGSKSREVGCDS